MSPSDNPALQYGQLKDLHLETPLVRGGRPAATVIAPASGEYDDLARRIQEAVREGTGVELPIAPDTFPAAAVPLAGHTIVLGNRSTNRTIEELYNRHFCLLDLRYPGAGGHVLRSLHNPFGNGWNAVLVGGSDGEGVAAAVAALGAKLRQVGGGGSAGTSGSTVSTAPGGDLSLGWLMDTAPGEGMRLPEDLRDFEIWEASAGYGSVGYFGWNSLSKRLAAYYMTGDPEHARQFLRLAFPDDEAKAEIAEIDGERVENKDDPLCGPYHYNAHMMILYWDLVEESPVFSEADRLRVTNAFARQFFHAEDQAYRRQILDNAQRGAWPYDEVPPHVGTRHGQWSAISLFCLCRYFQRDYPAPLWEHGMAAARQHFASLKHHAWVGGENDNLFWYCTGVAPILSYLLLTGERERLENGNLPGLLRGLDILISGREPDWALNSASIGFLHKAAYLTGDGRFLEYARRTGVDRSIFRMGQAYWPAPQLGVRLPEDLTGQWSIHPVPEPMWRTRQGGLPHEESTLFGSYRSAADHTGDFLLIKGLNGASRNPYHTFAVLEARLDGDTVLAGFLNQVRVRVGGVVEPQAAMDAALRHCAVVGEVAVVRAEVPHAPFCSWERTVLLRMGQCLVVSDRLRFRAASVEAEVEVWWEGKEPWQAMAQAGCVEAGRPSRGQVHVCDALLTEVEGKRARMVWRGPVEEGRELVFLSLVGLGGGGELGCQRLGPRAAVLRLPEPALAGCGGGAGLDGDLVVLTGDRVWGTGVRRVALEGHSADGKLPASPQVLLEADVPVDVDWDLASSKLHVSAARPVRLELATHAAVEVCHAHEAALGAPVDLHAKDESDQAAPPRAAAADACAAPGSRAVLDLQAGRHYLTNAIVDAATRERVAAYLSHLAALAEREVGPLTAPQVAADLPTMLLSYSTDLGSEVTALDAVSCPAGQWLAAAADSSVYLLDPTGAVARTLAADGPIRVLHWWPEAGLLLAGCIDEQVIAFDPDTGERAWVFTSEMDAAVWRAAKTYWFKSQPGHEGIHGLHTGAFLDYPSANGTQAFVGSACTLEILDAGGNLLERLPVFWGPGTQFGLIDGPDGGPRLLVAREPTDSHQLAVIDRDALDARPRGYCGVPEGHTDIGGWACMSRDHIFYADVDGDGQPEVVSEINGTWNRITVWAADGTPRYNLQLGPGDVIPARNVRDLELVDVNGDGFPEILAALSSGLVLVVNGRCEPLWSRRLTSPPVLLSGMAGTGQVLVACEDGAVLVLDGTGTPLAQQRIAGRARYVTRVPGGVALGTADGQVAVIEATG